MNFGQAIDLLKRGHRVTRLGGLGRNMWLAFMPPMTVPAAHVNERTRRFVQDGDLRVGGYLVAWTAQAIWQPGWTPSQADMLAEDWEVLPDEMGRAPSE